MSLNKELLKVQESQNICGVHRAYNRQDLSILFQSVEFVYYNKVMNKS